MLRRRVVFGGRVQGVGFRATAVAAAEGRGVTGWVRNEHDGGVTLEVQGEEAEVEAFLADLRQRMAGRIHKEMASEMGVEQESAFRVRH